LEAGRFQPRRGWLDGPEGSVHVPRLVTVSQLMASSEDGVVVELTEDTSSRVDDGRLSGIVYVSVYTNCVRIVCLEGTRRRCIVVGVS
jgi:hypothetical protein